MQEGDIDQRDGPKMQGGDGLPQPLRIIDEPDVMVGVVGLIMKTLGFPLAPMILGVVLGHIA